MAIATIDDVAARMGLTFTVAQEAQAELLLESATGIVAAAAGKDDDWAAALSPVPAVVKAITVEMVRRAMVNPSGLSSSSEQLGQYQYSEGYRQGAGELSITETERLQLRRAVWGTLAAGWRADTLADHLCRNSDGMVVVLSDADCS